MANILLASLSSLDISLQSLEFAVSIPVSETSMSISKQPNITIIDAVAFLWTSKLPDSSNFELYSHSLDIWANSTKLAETLDLSNIPSKYHKFANVFSKTKAEVLTSYHPYNLKINLEEGAQPLIGPIYSLSASKQEVLKKFIEKNLNTGFIWSISSLYSALVLFIKKKDGSLCLCVNFYSLNYISKRNCYLLPLISNLLDLSHKVQVYSKIDLHHTYHLVCITDSDEWKTAFRICYGLFE